MFWKQGFLHEIYSWKVGWSLQQTKPDWTEHNWTEVRPHSGKWSHFHENVAVAAKLVFLMARKKMQT